MVIFYVSCDFVFFVFWLLRCSNLFVYDVWLVEKRGEFWLMFELRLNVLRFMVFVLLEVLFLVFFMVVVVFVFFFYVGLMGLGFSIVGLIFGLIKLWDVFIDLVVGVVLDCWYIKWGCWLFWLVVLVLVLGLCIYMMFVFGFFVGGVYFVVWMVLFYIGWMIGLVLYIVWVVEFLFEYYEWLRIFVYK